MSNPFEKLGLTWEMVVQGIPDHIIVADATGLICYINQIHPEWKGESIVGQSMFDYILPEYRSVVSGALKEAFETGEEVYYEVETKSPEGNVFWYATQLGPIQIDGSVRAVSVIARDITDKKQLEREIIKISDREQRRVGQDIHDGLSQDLTGIAFLGKALEQRLVEENHVATEDATQLIEIVKQAIDRARLLARGLNPLQLELRGLAGAMQEICDHFQTVYSINCHFEFHGQSPKLSEEESTHLYRIAQEALHNAIKHGQAKNITVQLLCDDNELLLKVQDDGQGFVQSVQSTGMGLNIMKYRARMIGGQIDIDCQPGRGVLIQCRKARSSK